MESVEQQSTDSDGNGIARTPKRLKQQLPMDMDAKTEKPSTKGLLDMPQDVFDVMFNELDYQSALRVEQTSTVLRDLVQWAFKRAIGHVNMKRSAMFKPLCEQIRQIGKLRCDSFPNGHVDRIQIDGQTITSKQLESDPILAEKVKREQQIVSDQYNRSIENLFKLMARFENVKSMPMALDRSLQCIQLYKPLKKHVTISCTCYHGEVSDDKRARCVDNFMTELQEMRLFFQTFGVKHVTLSRYRDIRNTRGVYDDDELPEAIRKNDDIIWQLHAMDFIETIFVDGMALGGNVDRMRRVFELSHKIHIQISRSFMKGYIERMPEFATRLVAIEDSM